MSVIKTRRQVKNTGKILSSRENNYEGVRRDLFCYVIAPLYPTFHTISNKQMLNQRWKAYSRE
jgi:hypothetical protein